MAKQSEQRQQHAAIIVRGGSFQSFGINTYRNQPGIIHELTELGVHAEINALRCCKRTEGAILYVARVNNKGEPRQSRPCSRCIEAMKKAGIKRVVYSISTAMNI